MWSTEINFKATDEIEIENYLAFHEAKQNILFRKLDLYNLMSRLVLLLFNRSLVFAWNDFVFFADQAKIYTKICSWRNLKKKINK